MTSLSGPAPCACASRLERAGFCAYEACSETRGTVPATFCSLSVCWEPFPRAPSDARANVCQRLRGSGISSGWHAHSRTARPQRQLCKRSCTQFPRLLGQQPAPCTPPVCVRWSHAATPSPPPPSPPPSLPIALLTLSLLHTLLTLLPPPQPPPSFNPPSSSSVPCPSVLCRTRSGSGN